MDIPKQSPESDADPPNAGETQETAPSCERHRPDCGHTDDPQATHLPRDSTSDELAHVSSQPGPIHRLPPELLMYIFVLAAEIDVDNNSHVPLLCAPNAYSHTKHPSEKVRHTLTLVSHHWKETALQTAELWSHISLGRSADDILELIDRSKQAPLRLMLRIDGFKEQDEELPQDIAKTIFEEAHRIESLNLSLPLPLLDKLIGVGSENMPHLRSVFMEGSSLGDEMMPKIFEGRVYPNLRQMTMIRYRTNFSNPLFAPTLTFLRIGNADTTANMLDALDVIANMPALRIIFIGRFGEPQGTFPTRKEKVVVLSQLRHLQLDARMITAAHFLQSLVFPSSAMLDLRITELDGTVINDIQLFAELLVAKLGGTNNLEPASIFRSVYVSHGGFYHILDLQVRLYTKSWELSNLHGPLESGWREKPHIFLGFNVPGLRADIAARFLEVFLGQIPLSSVNSIYVSGCLQNRAYANLWGSILPRMPLATTLGLAKLKGQGAHHLSDMFSPRIWTQPDLPNISTPPVSPFLLPKLSGLLLENIEFKAGLHDANPDSFIAALIRLLSERKKGGIPVGAVSIANCVNMDATDVGRLSEHVSGDVEWDQGVQVRGR